MATEIKVKTSGSYLIRERYTNNNPVKIICKDVTKTSYFIEWESGKTGWMTKDKFENNYEIIEEL